MKKKQKNHITKYVQKFIQEDPFRELKPEFTFVFIDLRFVFVLFLAIALAVRLIKTILNEAKMNQINTLKSKTWKSLKDCAEEENYLTTQLTRKQLQDWLGEFPGEDYIGLKTWNPLWLIPGQLRNKIKPFIFIKSIKVADYWFDPDIRVNLSDSSKIVFRGSQYRIYFLDTKNNESIKTTIYNEFRLATPRKILNQLNDSRRLELEQEIQDIENGIVDAILLSKTYFVLEEVNTVEREIEMVLNYWKLKQSSETVEPSFNVLTEVTYLVAYGEESEKGEYILNVETRINNVELKTLLEQFFNIEVIKVIPDSSME